MPDDVSPDSTSTNGSISAGQTVTGELESVGDQDWYAVSLTAGTEYTIDLTSSDVDSYLYLMNSSGTQIDSDDDSGGNLNSQIVYTPTSSGTSYLVSDSLGNNDIGSYQLSISTGSTPTPTTSDDYINGIIVSGGDAGDSTSTAASVNLDSNGDASITGSVSGDNDCYQFTASGTGTATIDLTGLTDRVYMRLYDSNGSQLTSTSQTEESSKSLSYDVVAGQSYIVKVDPYSSATSNYDLSINSPTGGSSPTPTDDISPDNTSTNGSISAGQTVTGELESVGDQDWYAVSLTAGTEYTIDLTSSDVDSYLYLMNSSGTQIDSDDDSGGNLNSQIVYTPTSSGTSYLVSDSLGNNDIGSYQLVIKNK